MKAQESGKSYDVVIIGSMGVNPNFRLVNNPDNPGIVDEYRRGFNVLRSLPADVPLGSHPAMFNMAEKYGRLKSGRNPFIDPDGYKAELDIQEGAFTRRVAEQRAAEAR
jgi:metallo-beta-lactamase class B